MPDGAAGSGSTGTQPSPVKRARPGIHSIRQSLGLGEKERALVQEAGVRLRHCIEGWVDAFYARLLDDPAAMKLLDDDARVIRLKRSLTAWFHEMFSLPYDDDFERVREAIGEAHVRLEMPTYLMVTSMSRLRQDVTASVREMYEEQPALAREIGRVMSLALDMELALIMTAFRRRDRALARRQDRVVYAQRAARRFAHILFDRVDAALCYAELASKDGDSREQSLTKLKDVLRGLAHFDHRMQARVQVEALAPRRVPLAELCARALGDVSLEGGTRVEVEVEPNDLSAVLVVDAVQLAIEELVQNGVLHAPGGCVRVACAAGERDRIEIRVTDEGPGWDPSVREFRDIYALGSGLGLSFCEIVTELHGGAIELFTAPSGGAGVRLDLPEAAEQEGVGA